MKKSFIGILLSLVICFSFSMTINVNAADAASASSADSANVENNTFNGEIIPTPEQENNYLQSLSESDREIIAQKTEAAQEFANIDGANTIGAKGANTVQANTVQANTVQANSAAYKISIPGTFTMYQQENNYYCAPASVESVLEYDTGCYYTQSDIASDLGTTSSGTDATKIAPYLNTKQDDNTYIRTATPNQSTMCNDLAFTIAGWGYPCLMSICNPTGANWHYGTNGHRLVINAVYSDDSKIQFADPLGGWEADWPCFYEKTAAIANSVCRDVIW
ncbi:MAG: C39 family peptidase [Bacillota bacterium]|nr:C39 family peptidase [Bacillota bacterium]